jgi:hypothetical protein
MIELDGRNLLDRWKIEKDNDEQLYIIASTVLCLHKRNHDLNQWSITGVAKLRLASHMLLLSLSDVVRV